MTEPVLGFRRWSVTYDGRHFQPRLRGRVSPTLWELNGWTEARCIPALASIADGGHEAPHRECECGLYAYHSLVPALARLHAEPHLLGAGWDNSEDRDVIGAVIGAGRVIVHGIGWRAQYARPVVLATPEAAFPAVSRLAAAMGIPVVTLDRLESFAAEFGDRVRAA